MKKILLSTLFIVTHQLSFTQTNPLQTAIHWKLYGINKNAVLRYPVDSLVQYRFIALTADRMSYFLKEIHPIEQNKGVAWMGGYYTTCEINHRLRKIDISKYGGFVYDEQDRQYYELPAEIRDEWMSYLNISFKNIPIK